MARLDRSAPLRRIAQVGAAIGREFSYTLISAVSRLSEVDLQAALDRLVASGLAFQRGTPPDAVYRFKHALVQDAAYSTLLRGKRRMLHATIAEKLTERFPESAETAPETIAQHLTEAGAYAAAAVGPERARCEAELHLRLAEVYRAKLGICAHEVSRSFKRALDLGDELKDDNIRAAAGNGYQNFLFNCGQLDASVQICEELLNNFPSTDASLRMYLTHTPGAPTTCEAILPLAKSTWRWRIHSSAQPNAQWESTRFSTILCPR
jgi:predicted ATPase